MREWNKIQWIQYKSMTLQLTVNRMNTPKIIVKNVNSVKLYVN